MAAAPQRMLWIDARRRRDAPSAASEARAAFDVVSAVPSDPQALRDPPHILAIELDGDTPLRVDALVRAIMNALPREGGACRDAHGASIAVALAYIERNLAGRVTLAEAARECRLSRCELSRRFRRECGETFSGHVLRRRVERAQAMLARGERSVSAAAYAAGFNDPSYFARVFRRQVGMPASEYQSRMAGAGTTAASA